MSGSTEKKALKDARELARETTRVLKYRGHRLKPEQISVIEELVDTLNQNIGNGGDKAGVRKAADALKHELAKVNDVLKKATIREYVQSLGSAILIALAIRAFLFEPFRIPTGSMIPTLEIGDHLFVTKFTYGLRIPFTNSRFFKTGTPQRGEVMVFEYPRQGPDYRKDFIKRVVAVGGDSVRLTGNRLFINGEPVQTEVLATGVNCEDDSLVGCLCDRQRETLGGVTYISQHLSAVQNMPGCLNSPDWPTNNPHFFRPESVSPNAKEIIVPEGHALCIGDNRDNSSDGRFWGFVPVNFAKGRSLFFWWPPGRWFTMVHQ